MGKECMARLSRRLWGGTRLKTAAKEATSFSAAKRMFITVEPSFRTAEYATTLLSAISFDVFYELM